jgi:hypothetical protein
MKIENGKLILERKNCTNCQEGKVIKPTPCPECNGTGNGKRGGKRQCKKCYGNGKQYSWDNTQTCPQCNGNYISASPEITTDCLPENIFQALDFQVVRIDREANFNELNLGLGCLWSVGDYGAAWAKNDDKALIAEVKSHGHNQACKVINDDLKICDYIAIVVTRGGYSVRPIFKKNV